ncbi:MAG: hypothetical protein MJ208_03755 [Bacilli bacterium]|nr:hypothetical protein [Bacilli bacterium]
MNSKIKLIIPFTVIAATLFNSCAHDKDVNIAPLNRVSYNSVSTFSGLNNVFQTMLAQQFKETNPKNNYQKPDGDFQIFDKGTVNVKYKIKLSGTIKVDYDPTSGISPINYNNLNLFLNDDISISWDASDPNSYYMKIVNSLGSFYIGCEVRENGMTSWYRYCNTPINGKNYKIKIVNQLPTINFRNFILCETLYDSSFSISTLRLEDNNISSSDRIGFDLSGFLSTNPEANGYTFYANNLLSPGSIACDPETTAKIDEILSLGIVEGLTMKFGSNNNKTALISANVNDLDLSVWSSVLEVFSTLAMTGKLDLDYFVAYADSFIHQQEISLKLKDVNVDGLIGNFIYSGVVNISNLNVELFANEEVIQDCTRESFDPTQYVEL